MGLYSIRFFYIGGLFLLFFLSSCNSRVLCKSSKSCPPEENRKDRTKKLIFPSIDEFRGMSLEILYTPSGTYGYLSVSFLSFPKDKEQPAKTLVKICSNDTIYTFLAERLGGEQKILLPKEALLLVISTLKKGGSLSISSGRYHLEISPSSTYTEIHSKFGFWL